MIVPTKLDVFGYDFDVDSPHFLREAAENCKYGLYPVCWKIFVKLLMMVASRSAELNDPILNVLMLRLNLYDVPKEKRRIIIDEIKEQMINESTTL